jgi:16S rRNA U516 pseudouridylate synthase RsuA-like enzyme
MRRVNWTITEGQHRALKRLSQETGLPISELVRRAIDKYIGLVGEEGQKEQVERRREKG